MKEKEIKTQFMLMLELANAIEKEAQRRFNLLTPEEKQMNKPETNHDINDDWYYQRDILDILKTIKRPVGTNTIAELTGMKTSIVLHRMKALIDYKKVRKLTARKVSYWELI